MKHSIIILLYIIIFQLVTPLPYNDLSNLLKDGTNVLYDTRFYIHNNVTGTGNILRDEAYRSLCNGLGCICCLGEIETMTCGPKIICKLLNRSYVPPSNTYIYSLASIIGSYVFGFLLLAIGYNRMTDEVYSCKYLGVIIYIIGLVVSFPLGFIVTFFMFKRISKNFKGLIRLRKYLKSKFRVCRKGGQTAHVSPAVNKAQPVDVQVNDPNKTVERGVGTIITPGAILPVFDDKTARQNIGEYN
jgi:hypothetical protein